MRAFSPVDAFCGTDPGRWPGLVCFRAGDPSRPPARAPLVATTQDGTSVPALKELEQGRATLGSIFEPRSHARKHATPKGIQRASGWSLQSNCLD